MAHDITHYTQRPDVQKVYTTHEIADLLEISTTLVRNIASYYHIEYQIVQTGHSRAMMFTYDGVREIKARYEARLNKKKQSLVKIERTPEENEKLEDHSLVTDKRYLSLNYWPDVIPNCFEEEEVE